MGIFKRLFKIGQANANAAVDKLEDPIKMAEQGIRDLKKDLDKSLQGLAEIKALHIRAKNEAADYKNKAAEFEQKAMLLLQKAQKGQLDAAEADRLASEALVRKQEFLKKATEAEAQVQKLDGNVKGMEANVQRLKNTIAQYENELKTMRARTKVSESTAKLNKQMAQLDNSSTISMLERMKEKVDKQEALAEAYSEMATPTENIDSQIEKALAGEPQLAAGDELAKLKEQLNKNN